MIIAPVIFLTVATGIASIGETKALGRVVGKTFAYFLFFSTLALIVGLVVANVIQPGAGMNIGPEIERALKRRGRKGIVDDTGDAIRSEERRVGKEGVGPCRSRWSPDH